MFLLVAKVNKRGFAIAGVFTLNYGSRERLDDCCLGASRVFKVMRYCS